jgi:hypothetical protein
MRRLKHPKTGEIVAIELTIAEMAKALDVEVRDLEEWTTCIAPYSMDHGAVIYRVRSADDVQKLKKRAALLRTRMTEQAVIDVEKSGLLDAYSALAADCPRGITAHQWRSYGLIVLMQIRYGKMLTAEELAQRANLVEVDPKTGEEFISVELAESHMRLLRVLGYLEVGKKDNDGDWTGQFKHQGLPAAWVGMET